MIRVLLLICMAASALLAMSMNAVADQIDVTAEMLRRLGATPANHLPGGYILKSVNLKNAHVSAGPAHFKSIPEGQQQPLGIEEFTFINCSSTQTQTDTATVDRTIGANETISASTTLGVETTVNVGYESPAGVSVGASLGVNYSATGSNEHTASRDITWSRSIQVMVPPSTISRTQFSVTESNINIPWTSAVTVSGPIELTYEMPGQWICVHDGINGQAPGYSGKAQCWGNVTAPINIQDFTKEPWADHKGNMNDAISSFAMSAGAKVTLYDGAKNYPPSIVYEPQDGIQFVNDLGPTGLDNKISSMIFQPSTNAKTLTVHQNAETLLGLPQRTFMVSGIYTGASTSQGHFKALESPVTAEDCTAVGGQQAVFGTSSKQAVGAPGLRRWSRPMRPGEPVINGKVLH